MDVNILTVLISSLVGSASAMGALYLKRRFEVNDKKKEEYDVYKHYAKPLVSAGESLAYRLMEMLKTEGNYLVSDAPKGSFFKYKYDSTIFRLAYFLGWLRAVQREQTYIEAASETQNSNIRDKLNAFRNALADGGGVEVSIVEELVSIYGLPKPTIDDQRKRLLGAQIERTIFSYSSKNIVKEIPKLDFALQVELLTDIMRLICTMSNEKVPEKFFIEKHVRKAIPELTRRYCYIYRDLQNAIGDEMLVRMNGSNRHYDVKGYYTFMNRRNSKWMSYVDNLFADLVLNRDDRFDARSNQIKLLYCRLVDLMGALNENISNGEGISVKSMDALQALREDLIFTKQVDYKKLASSTPIHPDGRNFFMGTFNNTRT